MTEIKLHNTLSRTKESFVPIDPDHVRIYVCGPTVYDRAHIGNARPAVVFDVLVRLLRHAYPKVTYVTNITDVDDKINARAADSNRSIRDITEETVDWYRQDMAAIGVALPDHQPRATEYIEQMITMAQELIDKGFAYVAEDHVLFDVRSYGDYGKLSGRSVDDMIAGARVEIAPYKRDPMDFVIWKPAGDGPGWESPWGKGRPGWHIECSAMAREHLGTEFDIHGGGLDLQFPHHENELAQSNCAHGTTHMARYWVHNEMLQVEGKKMSKSLGNFFTVRDLLTEGVPGEVIRFVLLSAQYSKTMDWTQRKAKEAETHLRKWYELTQDVDATAPGPRFLSALGDDLNTPGAIAVLHELAKTDPGALKASANLLGLLGTPDWTKAGDSAENIIQTLLDARADARAAKDFARADAIRDAFNAAGVEVMDSPTGATWELKPGFDLSKLEELT